MLNLYDFTIEYRENPIGLDAKAPRLSWKLSSDQKNVRQTSYRVMVCRGEELVWDSGHIESEQSICVRYQGAALEPKTAYTVSISVTDNYGESAEIGGFFETGLMSYENMLADWITHGFEDGLEPPAVFKKRFTLKGDLVKARLYASALGLYEFTINGVPGSDVHFAPGWTDYRARIQYQCYDVTALLKEENELTFTVGNGWYKGILGFFNQGDHYGKRTALIAQLDLSYADGSRESVCTDASWLSSTGPVRYSEIYHGETIDYTAESAEERTVQLLDQPKSVLVAQGDEPVRITERILGQRFLKTPEGDLVIDFGQNLTGVIELRTRQPRGTVITVRHAEALDEKGNFFTRNLRTARATDTFVCSGGEDYFRPAFTYHGFRYIAVTGLGENLNPADFTACVIHTDLKKTGDFRCNDERVNRLFQNIDWGLRDNFLDVPTDCPQRDERLGYTGDGQIFLPTAACLRSVPLFFEKWLQDLKYEQSLGMGIPTTIPNIMGPGGGIAIWHDAGTIVPWTLYENYGDLSFLEEQFDSMKDTVDYYTDKIAAPDGLIRSGQQLGDWISMDVPRGPIMTDSDKLPIWNLELNEKIGATDPYFIANVYYLNSADLTRKAAKVLGRTEDEKKYAALYDELLQKIRDEYITKNGRMLSDTQCANAMALHFGVCEEKNRQKVMERLLYNLQQHKNHLTTGFAGTPFLCPVLSENGAHDVAGAVFLKDDCPSWLYSVKLGGTTMWELWDGVNPDGSFNLYEMNSLNHYSYGSIGGWIFHCLLGLDKLEPGYKKAKIAPRLIKGLPELRGSIDTVYGTLACVIACYDGKYTADIEIPANTTAELSLPGRESETLGSGCYHFEYETTDSFVKERYDMDTKFGELMDNPIASAMMTQYAKELMENELFMMFAKERPIMELMAMLPPEAMGLIQMVMKACNDAEKG